MNSRFFPHLPFHTQALAVWSWEKPWELEPRRGKINETGISLKQVEKADMAANMTENTPGSNILLLVV